MSKKLYEVYIDSFDIYDDIDDDDRAVYEYYITELSGGAYFQDILTAESLEDAIAKMDGARIEYYGKEWWIAYVIETEVDEVGNCISQADTYEYRVYRNYNE